MWPSWSGTEQGKCSYILRTMFTSHLGPPSVSLVFGNFHHLCSEVALVPIAWIFYWGPFGYIVSSRHCYNSAIAPFSTNIGSWGNWDYKLLQRHFSGHLWVPWGIGGWGNGQNMETKDSVHFAGESPLSSVTGEQLSPWPLWHLLEQETSPWLLSFGHVQKRQCSIL